MTSFIEFFVNLLSNCVKCTKHDYFNVFPLPTFLNVIAIDYFQKKLRHVYENSINHSSNIYLAKAQKHKQNRFFFFE